MAGKACEQLGWDRIDFVTANSAQEAQAWLRAERDENVCRLELSSLEKLSLTKAIEPLERQEAKEREQEGGRKGGKSGHKGSEKFSNPSAGRARDKVGAAVGWSGV